MFVSGLSFVTGLPSPRALKPSGVRAAVMRSMSPCDALLPGKPR